MFKKILLSLLITAQAFGAATGSIDADTIKSTDHTKTFTFPSASDELLGKTNPTIVGSLVAPHIATPSNPSAGYLKLFAKSDNKLYKLTSAGVESAVGGGAASEVTVTPVGSLIATDVQTALQELDSDLTAHLNDTVGAHAASAISFDATGNPSFVGQTTVQGVLGVIDDSFQEWEVTEGGVVTRTATQSLTFKDYDGGTATNTSRMTVPQQSKSTLDSLSRKEATLWYANDEDKLYVDDGANLKAVGNNSGTINYISNPDAETNTTGWATYADAAATTPVNGTAGSPTVTFTRTTSSPLRSTGSFLITKDAANRQGEGASYDFTIASADKYTVQTVKFSYEVASGTYADGDLRVYLYDVTNSALIEPVGYSLYNTSVNGKHQAVFQSTSSTSYRLIFHTASTSAVAYTVKIDDVEVGPQVKARGPITTDWTSFTSAVTSGVGVGTPASSVAYWRRNGDSVEVTGSFVTGTVASSLVSVSLPSGMSIDQNKLGVTNTTANPGERRGIWTGTAADIQGNVVTAPSTSTTLLYFGANNANTGRLTPTNGSSILGSTQNVTYQYTVPIAGWGSSQVLSSDEDGRVTALVLTQAATISTTNGGTVIFTVVTKDTHGAFNTGTGIITIKVPGDYALGSSIIGNSGTIHLQLYINGVWHSKFGSTNAAVTGGSQILTNLKAGDTLEFKGDSTNGLGYSAGAYRNILSLHRLSGPAQIAASESVIASYHLSANFAATTAIPINFDTKETDSHGAVTTGATTWKFTAPISGQYLVTPTTTSAGGVFMFVYKNGSVFKNLQNAATSNGGGGSVLVPLLATEYVDIRPASNATMTGGTKSTGGVSNIQIIRVGNY